MGAVITDTGSVALLHRIEVMREFARYQVVVGILESGHADDAKRQDPELTVLFIASIHEFGAPSAGIPERSFVRGYVDSHEHLIRAKQKELATRALTGHLTAKEALNQLGAYVAGGIQQFISDGIAPPDKQSTVERKGSSTPLVDTGQTRSSVTWQVRPAQ